MGPLVVRFLPVVAYAVSYVSVMKRDYFLWALDAFILGALDQSMPPT